MKKFIIIMIIVMIAFYGCDNGSNFYDREIVVSEDCTIGDRVGVEFDSDSVRCGMSGNIYFGIGRKDESDFSPFAFYVFSDSGAKNTRDSVWILETDSDRYSSCEKKEISSKNFQGTFCLKKFYDSTTREMVNYYDVLEKNGKYEYYFIYSKYDSYKAFCNISSKDCELLYSCVVLYDGLYNFSKVPYADNAKRRNIGCVF